MEAMERERLIAALVLFGLRDSEKLPAELVADTREKLPEIFNEVPLARIEKIIGEYVRTVTDGLRTVLTESYGVLSDERLAALAAFQSANPWYADFTRQQSKRVSEKLMPAMNTLFEAIITAAEEVAEAQEIEIEIEAEDEDEDAPLAAPASERALS